ncbi:MAG TPA: hypothetical protein VGN75_17020 [Kaistia sp.]|jgi:hypothetical protein|nr:hypothetical protein [Kaistia sp.]
MNTKFPPLHSVLLNDADSRTGVGPSVASLNNGVVAPNASVEVVFRDLEHRLIQEIGAADAVFGCIAWLTHSAILKALSYKRAVGIVVQKEDFLRPDSLDISKAALRTQYTSLPDFYRHCFGPTSLYDYAGEPSSPAIRCAGYRSTGRGVFPRMHNKFFVMCKEDIRGSYQPYAVWTGSYNPTYNASNSLENAVIIRDAAIANAYAKEFGVIFGISEPLNWSSTWVEPEHRLGS